MADGDDMSRGIEMNEYQLLPISDHNGNTTRQNNQLKPLILLYWSMELFIAGAGRAAAAVASLSRVSSYSVLSSTDAQDGLQDLEIGVVDDGADGPEPAVFGHNNGSASQTGNIGVELQHQRSLKTIFREKNLQSLNDRFGGVAGVANKLKTHLETGIPDNSEQISQRKMIQVSQNWALSQNYLLHSLKEPCKLWSMALLFLAGVLSLVFGIKEEGLHRGWVDGVIVFGTLFVLLLLTPIRNWIQARRARKKSQKEQISQKVGVVRGGKEVLIYVSDLVYGDLVCLEAGCLVPADGLFVSGKGLEIDEDGRLCNEQNPFLFYGSRVVKGSAKMLVISKGIDDTVLGEMMREPLALSTQRKTKTETQIGKGSEIIYIIGLVLAIFMFVVTFVRFKKGKKDDDSGNRPDPKGPPAELERILLSLKIIFTESRLRVLAIGVSLVGLMEGVPFVAAIAIQRWNSKTLSDRASDNDGFSCVRMAEVTTICIDNNVDWLKDTTSQQETRDRPIASLLASDIKIVLFSQQDDVSELKQIVSGEIGISETDAADDKVLTLSGDELQQCPDEEMFGKLGISITVVGKCNSKLKQRIVRCLRRKGEVVAVVGERSGDAPVMKEADIGLAIESEYPEITTQSANVTITKGSFSLLIDMIICGRNENLQKFIQVEVIVTIASSLINFISALSSGDTPLSPIQIFWIYFLISFPGGLALLSEQPNKNIQDTIRPTGPLITKAMWVNILLQSSYQIAIFVTLQLKGTDILGISQEANESMIFNAFVFCQLFNIFSARGLKVLNIFKSIGPNPWFWVGSAAFVVFHLPFDVVYWFITRDAGLNWKQWLECGLICAVSWLMDLIAKLIDKFQVTEIARRWAPELSSTRDWLIGIMRRSKLMSLTCIQHSSKEQ